MIESVPAPTPPVSRVERLAAGMLAGGWALWWIFAPFLRANWKGTSLGWKNMQLGWQNLIAHPTTDLAALLRSIPVLNGIRSALMTAMPLGVPLLIAGGAAIVCGYSRHRWVLWWLTLGHGTLVWLQLVFVRRMAAVQARSFRSRGNASLLPWYEGWFDDFNSQRLLPLFNLYWPYLAETLLAVCVLGCMWWSRPRRKPNVA